MPGVHGVSGLLYLRAQHPEVPVVIVSASDDAGTIRQCLDCGASGFIPKSQPVERIREAIRRIIGGEVWLPPDVDLSNVPTGESAELVSRLSTLTPQQVRVLMMLGEGLLNKQIAFKLGVSEATIKAHVSAILQKLGVDSRTQAVIAITKIGGHRRLAAAELIIPPPRRAANRVGWVSAAQGVRYYRDVDPRVTQREHHALPPRVHTRSVLFLYAGREPTVADFLGRKRDRHLPSLGAQGAEPAWPLTIEAEVILPDHIHFLCSPCPKVMPTIPSGCA